MKFLLASSALAAAFAIAPAYAQQAPSPKPATVESTTEVTVTSESPPLNKAEVSEVTTIERTEAAEVETKTEVITPVSGRPTLDPENPIAPEVAAVVNSGKKYTTQDIVLAQLEAMRNTPITEPTTVITTTTTTPGG